MSPADLPLAPLPAPAPAPGPHPAPAELRAYAAGTLSAADEHCIEAHALDCERCADLLAGFSMTDAATTEGAVAALRTRLHTRLSTAESASAAGRWAWSRLAAAAAFVGVVAGGIWSWERHETPEVKVAAQSKMASANADMEIAAVVAPPKAPATTQSPAAAETADAAVAQAPEAPVPMAASRAPKAEGARPGTPPPRKAADYAAVSPGVRSAGSGGSSALRSAPAATGRVASAPVIVADDEARAEAKDAATPPETAALPGSAGLGAAMTSRAAAPSAQQSEGALADKAALPDALAEDRKPLAMSRFAKTKAASAPAATRDTPAANAAAPTARVRATPMPAAPAISPAPEGGTPALREYLRREAGNFTPENGATRLTGTVHLKFTVGADGKVSLLKVVRGLRPDYDAEALRMVCDGPAWQPGVAHGRRAPLPVELIVSY